MDVKRKKSEQSEATRAALLEAARSLFSGRGFAETPTEEIVRRAGVTRGALYHHFRSKEDLFCAVFEQVEAEVTARTGEAALGAGGVWEGILAAVDTYLDACEDPAVARITLIDAPSVLGFEVWHEVMQQYGGGLTQMALEAAMNDGLVERQPAAPLAQLLLGAFSVAGQVIARAEDPAAARAEMGAAVRRLLEGLGSHEQGPAPVQ